MKFITPCFVRVENPEKRKDLFEWLCEIGYVPTYRIDKYYPVVVAGLTKECVDIAPKSVFEGLAYYGLIDCGENIELYKALAAMNDDNDREQWFINDNYADVGCVMWHLCEEKKFKHYYVEWEDGETDICSDFRKATAEEIIEHFKSKQP